MDRKARTNYSSSHLQKNANNPKAFWNILRNVLPGRDKGRYIQNLVEDGKDLNDQEAIEESLNQYFTTIASSFLDGRTIVRHNQTKETTYPHVLNVPHLSEQDVFKVARPSTFVGTPSIFESLIP